jgi:hypothetical protein
MAFSIALTTYSHERAVVATRVVPSIALSEGEREFSFVNPCKIWALRQWRSSPLPPVCIAPDGSLAAGCVAPDYEDRAATIGQLI